MSALSLYNRAASMVSRHVAAVSMRLQVSLANLWRDHYNPLRGLTMQRAVLLLEEENRGAYSDLQWTYQAIEGQDATLGALIERRTSAIQQLDWNIKLRDDVPEDQRKTAERQEKALRSTYERIGNLSDAIEFLGMASFRGFSHLEKVRDERGRIVELDPVEQWHWVREGRNGEWKLNLSAAAGTNRGESVDLDQFVIREARRPINRVALVCFVRKGLSQKDWDGFVEQFGIPAIFVTLPEGVSSDDVDTYLSIAEQTTGDGRGVLPGGSKVQTVDNGARGANPFKDHLKYQDEQLVLRGTGGMLTMLTQSGSGTLAGSAHQEAFDILARAEAGEISELLQREIDEEILEAVTPGAQRWARFELAANEETDTSAIVRDVALLKRSGISVSKDWIEEKTGYALETVKIAMQSHAGASKADQGAETGSQKGKLSQGESDGILKNREVSTIERLSSDEFSADLADELVSFSMDEDVIERIFRNGSAIALQEDEEE